MPGAYTIKEAIPMKSKWTRLLTLAAVTCALIACALWWSRRPTGYASPEACLDAFYQAARDGNTAAYLACLAEPLRSRRDSKDLATLLRPSAKELKNWVQISAPSSDERTAQIDVDERRPGGRLRVKYRLEKIDGYWYILDIGPARSLPEVMPYGTDVGATP
jgi:hypothetical protein